MNLNAPNPYIRTLLNFAIGMLIILCSGCASNQMERDFFDKEYDQSGVRFDTYSITDQIKIYLYGMQFITPPMPVLSRQIAEHGQAAIGPMISELSGNPSEQNINDLMVVFEAMQSMSTYNVQGDKVLIRKLDGYVDGMKNKIVRGYTQARLARIKQSIRDAD